MSIQENGLIPQAELSAAYRFAAQRQAERVREGAAIIGHKVGYTNMSQWNGMGIRAPMWGAMYNDSVIEAGSGPFRYDASAIHGPRLEPELVVHFSKDPVMGAGHDALIECIDWVAHGFEIVMSRRDGKAPTVAQSIENGGNHGALLLGAPMPVAELGVSPAQALAGIGVELFCDGELMESGTSSIVLGHPLNAVAHLMEGLQREGMAPLKAGDIVSTGTMTAAYNVTPGQRWTSTLAGAPLGGLDITFE